MNKITLLKTTTSLTSAAMIALIPEAAYAMPPVVVAAATAALASTAAAWVMGTLTVSFMTAFMTSFALNVALGLVSQSLSPKPNAGGQPAGTSAILVSGLSPVADHQIIYGRTKIGGAVVY